MKPLGKEAEAKLLAAIEKTAELVNDGDTPNQAIIKAAREANVPPGHVNLMVQAYNTGRTTRQRQLGDDPLEKSADFDMADASIVLEALYPSQFKTAAQIQRETVVSMEYAVSPRGMLERREKIATLRRGHSLDWSLIEKPPDPLPQDPQWLRKKAMARVESNRRQADESRRLLSASTDKMASMLDELRDMFMPIDSPKFGYAKVAARHWFGEPGVKIFHYLEETTPGIHKRGHHENVRGVFALVEKIMEVSGTHTMLKKAHDTRLIELGKDTEKTIRPFVSALSRSVLDTPSSTEKLAEGIWSPFTQNVAGSFTKDILTGVAKNISPTDDSSLVNNSLEQLTDPAHESELRNIRVNSMLQDLMTNDPVISSYDPHETLNAFNEVGEAAPRAADQRLIMQSVLRQRLQQGSLDPFQVGQLLDMETKLKKRQEGANAASSESVL